VAGPALDPKNEFTFGLPGKTCNGRYDRWKYGVNDPPPYVGNESFTTLGQRYVHRSVI